MSIKDAIFFKERSLLYMKLLLLASRDVNALHSLPIVIYTENPHRAKIQLLEVLKTRQLGKWDTSHVKP